MAPAKAFTPRGTGHANLIVTTDYATGDTIFRVETDIHRTPENAKQFDELVKLVSGPERKTLKGRKRMLAITNAQVKAMRTKASDARAAKGMFSKAFGF